VSISCATLGMALYQQQTHQLHAQLTLSETVQQLAEQMDSCENLWRFESFFQFSPAYPFQHLAINQCSRVFLLNEIKNTYQLYFPQHQNSLPIYILIGKQTLTMEEIQREQIYFYCATLYRNQWMFSQTFRTYDSP